MLASNCCRGSRDIVLLGSINLGQKHLQDWQVDYVEPLLRSLGKFYILIVVDTVTGCYTWLPGYDHMRPRTIYVSLWHSSDSTQCPGTHFTGHKVQTWAWEKGIQWKLHVPYQPQAAGMIE
jgi:transposase InsO family protein